MSDELDTTKATRDQLLPLLDSLREMARQEQSDEQAAFFDRIRHGIAHAADPEDLAGPFMELSTAAFRGFRFSAPVALVLDRALAIAQEVSMALSAPYGAAH